MSDSEGGRAGSVYAGPRVRVRSGRMGKFPGEDQNWELMASKSIVLRSMCCFSSIEKGYLPIREMSRSSRKIEWYACIVESGLLAFAA